MILLQHIPAFPLSDWIDTFTYYKDFQPEHRLDRLLPDGNVTLIIALQDEPQHIYDNVSLKKIQICRNTWLSGLRSEYITIPSGRDREMFIINFKKGKAYPFLKAPSHVFTNHVVDGDLALRQTLHDLREELIHQQSVDQKFLCAEKFLMQTANGRLEANPCIDFAVKEILRAPGQQAIADISAKVGYSQKHLIHLFKTHVGMTPKTFMRVIRFQKVITDIEEHRQIDWSRIAFDCGYYDHAHFIHDFSEFTGMTPQVYLQVKNDQVNYVPVG